jgi:hypothetical protein
MAEKKKSIPVTKDNMKFSCIPPGFVGIGKDGIGIVELIPFEPSKSNLSTPKTKKKGDLVECEKCKAWIKEAEYQNHLENECPVALYEKMQNEFEK